MKVETTSGVAVLGFLLLGTSSAFVPIHRPTHSLSSPSTTTLQASFLDRFTRVARSNINNILGSFEDPEKVMVQAFEDMQRDLLKVRQTYAEVTATQRRLYSQKQQLEATADDWYGRAQLALRNGREDLAREALARREQLLCEAASIQLQVDGQAANIDKLYNGMQALEAKIMEAQSKKAQMAARARTAKSTVKVNDMLSGLTGTTSMDAFKRMEEKVLALEAAAEVSAEMGKLNVLRATTKTKATPDNIEAEFRRLEASSAVDQELEKLKATLLPPASEVTTPRQTIGVQYLSALK